MTLVIAEKNIEVMARLEETVGNLYATYAELYPDYADFWSNLEADEREHATRIRDLHDARINYLNTEGQIEFNPEIVEKSIFMITLALEDAITGQIDISDALSTALNIEDTLLERKFHEALGLHDDEHRKTIASIVNQMVEHKAVIADTLKTIEEAPTPEIANNEVFEWQLAIPA